MGEKGSSFGDYWKFYDKCKDIEAEVWSKNEFMNSEIHFGLYSQICRCKK